MRAGKADFGGSLMDAVKTRYGDHEHDVDSYSDIHQIGSKPIEFVGMQKIFKRQIDFRNLRNVVLLGMNVSNAGDLQELSSELRSCVELDLSDNLLFDWHEVLNIIRSLPYLRILNLSKNRFISIRDSSGDSQKLDSGTFEMLIMNECDMEWKEVLNIADIFPNLKKLGLCRNKITSTRIPGLQTFRELKELDLDGNLLESWDSIKDLAKLPRLESLNLSRTGMSSFEPRKNNETIFPSLVTLLLQHNRIATWDTVNELNKLPRLENLLLMGNPLFQSDNIETDRQMVIAKIGRLKTLDRSEISAKERRGAEIDYLKKFGREWLASGSKENDATPRANGKIVDTENFFDKHPRYLELVEKYGAPEESEFSVKETGVLQNRLVTVVIDANPAKPVRRTLPETMNVQKLKTLVGRMFRRNPRAMKLSYENAKRRGLKIPMDNDFRDISFYSLENGDSIYVN